VEPQLAETGGFDTEPPSPLAPVSGGPRAAAHLLLPAVLIVLFLLPLFGAPFERDQGAYATIARGWMEGALPYRDLWDNKGPLLFLWYAASFSLFGETVAAPRIAAALAAALSLFFVRGAARRLYGERVARAAGWLYALSFANVYLQVTANAEVFMLLPLAAGFWAFAAGVRKGGGGWYLLAGLSTALAVFTRQSAVLAFGAWFAWLAVLFFRRPEERRRQGAAPAWLAAGAVLGALPFILYFGMRGGLGDLWFAMFGFNVAWVAEQSFWLKFVPPLFIEPGPLVGGLLFWVLSAAGVWRLVRQKNREGWLLLAFLAAAAAAAQAMGKGSAHYSIQLLPGAAIAGAFGIPVVRGWWASGRRRLRAALAAATLVTAAAVLFAYLQPTAEERFRVQYTWRDYADDALAAPAIAREVARLSAPGDPVYEWGRSSQIYFLADRRPASRWLYNRSYEVDASMLDEVMADLAARPPAVVLVTGEIPVPAPLAGLLASGYRPAGRVEYATLYRSRSAE
jgi:4-amino-4-deoxy-L-arabinose transferase-like glycosyltransferase